MNSLTVEERAKIMLKMIVNNVTKPEDLLVLCTRFIVSRDDEVKTAVEVERERWTQRLPEDTFSVTIEGRFDKRIVANRKLVSMQSINATDGKTLLLEAEACAHQILQSLTTN